MPRSRHKNRRFQFEKKLYWLSLNENHTSTEVKSWLNARENPAPIEYLNTPHSPLFIGCYRRKKAFMCLRHSWLFRHYIFSQWTLRFYDVVFTTYLEDCSSTACKLPQIRHNPCLHHRTQKPPSSFRAVNKTLQEYPLVYHIVFQAALHHWSYSELPYNHTSKQRHHNVADYSLVLWAQHGILVSL